MQIIKKERKEPNYKKCELCNDGSYLVGNHKNSVKHITLSNRKDAIDYGLVTIDIPEYHYYTSGEYSPDWHKVKGFHFCRSKTQVKMPFGKIFHLETDYGYGWTTKSPSVKKEYWVKSEDLIEIYFELINIAIDLEHFEETVKLPKFEKESEEYDAFLENHPYWSEKPKLPNLNYHDTILDLQYATVKFPNIRKTIIVIKEADSNQFTIKTFRYYNDFDDYSEDGKQELIFGFNLMYEIKRYNVIRQGDLYLKPVNDFNEENIIYPSEDAQYTWDCGDFSTHKPEKIAQYFDKVVISGKLEHPEHKDIELGENWFEIISENNYD